MYSSRVPKSEWFHCCTGNGRCSKWASARKFPIKVLIKKKLKRKRKNDYLLFCLCSGCPKANPTSFMTQLCYLVPLLFTFQILYTYYILLHYLILFCLHAFLDVYGGFKSCYNALHCWACCSYGED